MRERFEWSDVKMLRAILVVLDTHSWACRTGGALEEDEIDDDTAEVKEAVEYITALFREPLEATGVSLATIQDEAEGVVHYARKYLSIGTEDYHTSSVQHQTLRSGLTCFTSVSCSSVYPSPVGRLRECSLH